MASRSSSGASARCRAPDMPVAETIVCVDCGGTCPQCQEGQGCTIDNDCAQVPTQLNCDSGVCTNHCGNGLLDGDETDVDCGGLECDIGCSNGESCDHGSDCLSNNCIGNVCQP